MQSLVNGGKASAPGMGVVSCQLAVGGTPGTAHPWAWHLCGVNSLSLCSTDFPQQGGYQSHFPEAVHWLQGLTKENNRDTRKYTILFHTYNVPGTLSCVICATTLWGRVYYYPHLTDGDMEAVI